MSASTSKIPRSGKFDAPHASRRKMPQPSQGMTIDGEPFSKGTRKQTEVKHAVR